MICEKLSNELANFWKNIENKNKTKTKQKQIVFFHEKFQKIFKKSRGKYKKYKKILKNIKKILKIFKIYENL